MGSRFGGICHTTQRNRPGDQFRKQYQPVPFRQGDMNAQNRLFAVSWPGDCPYTPASEAPAAAARPGDNSAMDTRQIARFRIISLFEDLTDAQLARIAQSCVVRTYERHAQILGEHDHANDVFFILDGSARINSVSAEGREIIYSDLGVGDIFGEFAAIDGLPRSANLIALTDCLLARMSAAKFFDLLRENGTVSTRLVQLLVAKIRRMSERVFEVSALAVRERVRRELLRLAAHGTRSGKSVVIQPAPTHYDLAARIGSHREAVTRELNRLEQEHIVEISRREIRIVDLGLLQHAEDS
jgi:CRP/FNR family cyclic AMP-dependent transcriptional regulator